MIFYHIAAKNQKRRGLPTAVLKTILLAYEYKIERQRERGRATSNSGGNGTDIATSTLLSCFKG